MVFFSILRRFWRGLCTNWIGTAGVVLTTSAIVLFVLAELLRMVGIITNTYVGLITYLSLPALFLLGLMLIPVGWWLHRRRTGKSTGELLSERFEAELVAAGPGGSRVFRIIVVLTLINVLFLGLGGARMLGFMDQPSFCGTACHSVMNPEWVTFQNSPHARVRCVDCHVGQGARAAFDAKLNGMWQMISVTFDLYERPIPTPVHNLRPARETCEKCHWPQKFYGNRLKRIVRHADDQASTPRYTTLSLKVGSGSGRQRGEIHWHVAGHNEVRYQPADRTRMAMRWVEVRQPDGRYRRFVNRRAPSQSSATSVPDVDVRVMDCVDCHNRATHIYEDPQDVVERRLEDGAIDRRLPFARRQALAALTGSYRPGTGTRAIALDFRGYYRRHHPQVATAHGREIDRAVRTLQAAYRRNIHERMNIGWNAYPDHIGHRRGPGCRRCHDSNMQDRQGRSISDECTLCHSILAYDSAAPFQFLQPPDPRDRECRMGLYLRREFLGAGAAADPDACKPGR